MDRIFEFIIDEHDEINIKTFLKNNFNASTELIKRLKQTDDGITVNGVRKFVNYVLKNGDRLKIVIPDSKSEMIVPKKIDFEIIYEDEDILIVNKPAGIATHPSHGHFDDTLANGIMYYFENKGEERTFRAVNRLDKDTSGLMCIAKNSYAHDRLCKSLHADFERRYKAIAVGTLTESGTVNASIARENESFIRRCVSDNGQTAVTHYTVMGNYGDYTLLELKLETGRTHQIRLHLSYIGYPLLGDWLYGEENKELFARTALHSSYLSLIHPVTNSRMEFEIPLPEDMRLFLEANKQM